MSANPPILTIPHQAPYPNEHIHRYLSSIRPEGANYVAEGHKRFVYEQEHGFEKVSSFWANGDESSLGKWSEEVMGRRGREGSSPAGRTTRRAEDANGDNRRHESLPVAESRRRSTEGGRAQRRAREDNESSISATSSANRREERKLRRRDKAAIRCPPASPPPPHRGKRYATQDESEASGSQLLHARPTKRRRGDGDGIGLMAHFEAKNVAVKRLTLKPSASKGFLDKGASSAPVRPFRRLAVPETRPFIGEDWRLSWRKDTIKAANPQSSTPKLAPSHHGHKAPQQWTSYQSGRLPPPGRTNSPSWPSVISISARSRNHPPTSSRPRAPSSIPSTGFHYPPPTPIIPSPFVKAPARSSVLGSDDKHRSLYSETAKWAFGESASSAAPALRLPPQRRLPPPNQSEVGDVVADIDIGLRGGPGGTVPPMTMLPPNLSNTSAHPESLDGRASHAKAPKVYIEVDPDRQYPAPGKKSLIRPGPCPSPPEPSQATPYVNPSHSPPTSIPSQVLLTTISASLRHNLQPETFSGDDSRAPLIRNYVPVLDAADPPGQVTPPTSRSRFGAQSSLDGSGLVESRAHDPPLIRPVRTGPSPRAILDQPPSPVLSYVPRDDFPPFLDNLSAPPSPKSGVYTGEFPSAAYPHYETIITPDDRFHSPRNPFFGLDQPNHANNVEQYVSDAPYPVSSPHFLYQHISNTVRYSGDDSRMWEEGRAGGLYTPRGRFWGDDRDEEEMRNFWKDRPAIL